MYLTLVTRTCDLFSFTFILAVRLLLPVSFKWKINKFERLHANYYHRSLDKQEVFSLAFSFMESNIVLRVRTIVFHLVGYIARAYKLSLKMNGLKIIVSMDSWHERYLASRGVLAQIVAKCRWKRANRKMIFIFPLQKVNHDFGWND